MINSSTSSVGSLSSKKQTARTRRKVKRIAGPGIALLLAGPARALVINTTFDSTVTSLRDSGAIQHAFINAAAVYANALSNPATVNIQVSWGQVAGTTLPSNAVASSAEPLYGY